MAPVGDLLRDQPLLGLATMFVAGLVTSLTPCVYPMIPIVAGVLGGTGAATRSRARTAAYTAARYGQAPPSAEQMAALQQAMARLEKDRPA